MFGALHEAQAMVVGVLHFTHQIEISSTVEHSAVNRELHIT
jgi:hypothetical protein